MLKQEKERIVAELVERLRSSDTLLLADYRGLDMTEIDSVRSELLKHGARFSVVKNTLTKRAADEAGVTELNEFLEGPTAIAFVAGGDMVAVAKALNDTAKRTKVLALKGGILQGRTITADQVRDLASLPPADVLQGQVLAAVVGPLNAVVGLFTAPLRDLVGIVDARIRQLEEQGETAAPAPSDAPEAEAAPDPTEEEAAEPVAEAAEAPADDEPQTSEDSQEEEG
jgi:large subunit ribosomal protein L10